MPTDTPVTARTLLALVTRFGPKVEGDELIFESDPQADLEPLLAVLHTGVRALLGGGKWWANAEDGRAGRFTRVRVIELDPGAPLPPGATFLCVEGDPRWDRIHPAAKFDTPQLFAPDGR